MAIAISSAPCCRATADLLSLRTRNRIVTPRCFSSGTTRLAYLPVAPTINTFIVISLVNKSACIINLVLKRQQKLSILLPQYWLILPSHRSADRIQSQSVQENRVSIEQSLLCSRRSQTSDTYWLLPLRLAAQKLQTEFVGS